MKNFYALAAILFVGLTSMAQTNVLVNYDFNSGTSYPMSPVSNANNITGSLSGTDADPAYGGVASGGGAFVSNSSGPSLCMANSSGTNTRYWTLTLGGSDLNKYINYKVYFQTQRSTTGAQAVTILYSTNGSSFTAFGQTASPADGSFVEALVDLSSVTALNNQTAIYLRFAASGASGTGTLRVDNLQVQASQSPWTMSGGNVIFSGGVTAANFNTSGPIAGGATTISSLTNTGNTLLSGTLKNTQFAGTGNRVIFTDANGNLNPLAAGTNSQVLLGNGTWGNLAVNDWLLNGNNNGSEQYIGTNDSYDLPFRTAGAEKMRIKTNGDVWINTGSQISFKSGDMSHGVGYYNTFNSISVDGPVLYGWAGGALATNQTISGGSKNIALQWLANGNVGIGINTPQYPLDVSGSVHIPSGYDKMFLAGTTTGSSPTYLSMGFDGNHSVISSTGTNLLLNWNNSGTGKDVELCTGNSGAYVVTGSNVEIGFPTRNANTALNIRTNGSAITTALSLSDNGNNNIFNVSSTGNTTLNGNINMTNNGIIQCGGSPVTGTGDLGLYSLRNGFYERFVTNNGSFVFFSDGGTTAAGSSPIFYIDSKGFTTINATSPITGGNIIPVDAFVINDNATGPAVTNFKVKTNGQVYAREVIVKLGAFPDYVFSKNYNMMPLDEVEKYINKNHHLPNMPTAYEVEKEGANLGEIQKISVEKIEELTLYMIEMKKELEKLKKENAELKAMITK